MSGATVIPPSRMSSESESPGPASVPEKKPASGATLPLVPLMSLAEAWNEEVCKEIVQLELVGAKIALPVEEMEMGLKQGRITCNWKLIRSWIKPAPVETVSAHDDVALELPLKVITPLFLAKQREAGKSQDKVAIDETIPNLFFGFPQTEAASVAASPAAARPASLAVAKPVDTNYYIWDDDSDQPLTDGAEVKTAPSPGTRFMTRYATPNEVVSRAAALEGVSGSLIALPDGLMVASQLSADLNGETLAAFLPQIFGKVSQCTKELRMGELNNLNFTVGNIPWKIFRVNAIFFAAFGRTGEALPTAQLAALAAELDHKPK